MQTITSITLRPEKGREVLERTRMLDLGYAVIYYPSLWGGNAHPKNRCWCVRGEPDEVDYGTLRYLEKLLQKVGRKYVIIRTKR